MTLILTAPARTFYLIPEFCVTLHAQQRLMERMGVKKRKIDKVVRKAWYTKNVETKKLNLKRYKAPAKGAGHYAFKELMGYVFVFDYRRHRGSLPREKVLITVI